jgi:hypothetical protein
MTVIIKKGILQHHRWKQLVAKPINTKNGATQVSVRCLLTCTVEVLGSTLGWYTDYPDGRTSVNFRSPLRKIQGEYKLLFVSLLLPP